MGRIWAFPPRWEPSEGSEQRGSMACLLLQRGRSGCAAGNSVVGGGGGRETREEATAVTRQRGWCQTRGQRGQWRDSGRVSRWSQQGGCWLGLGSGCEQGGLRERARVVGRGGCTYQARWMVEAASVGEETGGLVLGVLSWRWRKGGGWYLNKRVWSPRLRSWLETSVWEL